MGPPVLKRQVIGYDQVISEIEQDLLLLNIARSARGEPVHFTATSSIAATFDWTATLDATGRLEDSSGTDFFNLNLGASASENPTFSLRPVTGQEFTKRILIPFTDTAFHVLAYQAGAIDRIMRLMGYGFEFQNPDGSFVRLIENDPARPAEYQEFRRLAVHLRWLLDARGLFVRSLVFEELMVHEFDAVPRSQDITAGFDKGLKWRQNPDGSYELRRLQSGRIVMTNYDPAALTDQQRFELNEKIKRNPSGYVYVHLKPDGPGGEWPVQGVIWLRSMLQMLNFVASGIGATPEFDVAPDPRTRGPVPANPAATLKINVADDAPAGTVAFAESGGRFYSVDDTPWDRAAFATLGDLFQSAVGEVEDVGIPITIAK